MDVDVLCALAALSLYFILQKNRTLAVLEQNIVLDTVALRLHEVTSPTYRWHEVVSAHNISLCRASSIESMLGGS
jgi:hypothetical protein